MEETAMRYAHLLPVTLLTLSLSANAFSVNQGHENFNHRSGKTRTEMFADFKSIESYSHKERIRILQEAEACIQAAADRIQYKSCEQREKADRERIQEIIMSRHQAMRERMDGLEQGILVRTR